MEDHQGLDWLWPLQLSYRVNNLTYLFSSIKPSNQYRNNMPGKQNANIDCKQISQLIEPAQIMKIKSRQFLIIHFFCLLVTEKGLQEFTLSTHYYKCRRELEEHRFRCNFYPFLLMWNLLASGAPLIPYCSSKCWAVLRLLGHVSLSWSRTAAPCHPPDSAQSGDLKLLSGGAEGRISRIQVIFH